ncbi:hypothetical protein [Arenibaculum sp.]|uniref:hypothetical protein n=1 Tax=Arenibaculum sp. TaxID=2865862 RepID=UPI002E12B971|nr:hypothetical protein [Arenibaculum sp.]
MTRRSPAPGIGERVEQAIARSKGRLRLWLVFDGEEEVAQAKALIAAARSRHVEALTRVEWQRREERALRRMAPPVAVS